MASDEKRHVMMAPNGARIRGTSEMTPGTALVFYWTKGDDGDANPVYDGGTKVHWDGQETKKALGCAVVVDENGDEWLERECVLRLEDDSDDGLPLEEPEEEEHAPTITMGAIRHTCPDCSRKSMEKNVMVGGRVHAYCPRCGHEHIEDDDDGLYDSMEVVDLLRGRVNLPLLIEQKGTLVNLAMLGVLKGEVEQKHVEGLVHLLDWLQDRLERDR